MRPLQGNRIYVCNHSFRRRSRACVIVDDTPAFGQALEDECEAAMRLVACTLQCPSAKYNRRIRRKHRDFNIGEAECAHLCSVRIFLAIPIADGFPTSPDFVIGNKNGRCRFCVAVHKFVDVAPVPGILLCAEYRLNLRDCVCRALRYSADEGRHQNTSTDGNCPGGSCISGKREYRLQLSRSLIAWYPCRLRPNSEG